MPIRQWKAGEEDSDGGTVVVVIGAVMIK